MTPGSGKGSGTNGKGSGAESPAGTRLAMCELPAGSGASVDSFAAEEEAAAAAVAYSSPGVTAGTHLASPADSLCASRQVFMRSDLD